jgi:cobyrinic acid a,c-diamide synthase
LKQTRLHAKQATFPRIAIAALRGGSGKTILSVGIMAAWRRLGKHVVPFKKGPDYIDAGWLTLAAGRPCYNLDNFLLSENELLQSFSHHTQTGDIAVVEGNRGLYDGIDELGTTSTAELSKLLKLPVILIIDCTKSTRTMAALLLGCMHLDPQVDICGVILNRVAGGRHESVIRKSIAHHCGIPVLGAIPKLNAQRFPERHMGLLPTCEHGWAIDAISAAAEMATHYLELDSLFAVAQNCPSLPAGQIKKMDIYNHTISESHASIGVILDSAFQFYYPENLTALEAAGAKLVFISPLTRDVLPTVDALYIGGGFPETHAGALAANEGFRTSLKRLANDGLPIYAECGGLMYLGEALVIDGKSYPMAGVLPIVFGISKKPQGHGYTVVKVIRKNPYFALGTRIKGHEFHYSQILEWKGETADFVFAMERGTGMLDRFEGVCYRNVLATYTHIHALGTPAWAPSLVANARNFRYKSEPVISGVD